MSYGAYTPFRSPVASGGNQFYATDLASGYETAPAYAPFPGLQAIFLMPYAQQQTTTLADAAPETDRVDQSAIANPASETTAGDPQVLAGSSAPTQADLSRYTDIVEKADAFAHSLVTGGLGKTVKMFDLPFLRDGEDCFLLPNVLAEYLGISANEVSIALSSLRGVINPYDGLNATEAYELVNFISERAKAVLDNDGVIFDEDTAKGYADMYQKAQTVLTTLPDIGLNRFSKENDLKLYTIDGHKVLLPADVAEWYGLSEDQLNAVQQGTGFSVDNGLDAHEMYNFANYISQQTNSFSDAETLPGGEFPGYPPMGTPPMGGRPPMGTPPMGGRPPMGTPPVGGTPPAKGGAGGFEALLTASLNGLIGSLVNMGFLSPGFSFSYTGGNGTPGLPAPGGYPQPPMNGGGYPYPQPPMNGGGYPYPQPPMPQPPMNGGGMQSDSVNFSRYLAPAPFGSASGPMRSSGGNPFFGS